ncbi:MFS transporter [Alphaproteobacteria bacterium]|nr:MFS transporter [Alphaproteobacteria bacterium]
MVFNKNLVLLVLSQVFSFTAAPITVFLSGIVGSSMTSVKTLATLPVALMIVGTSLGSIFAAFLMSKIGRKLGFMIGCMITSFAGLLAAYSVINFFFILFCFSNLLVGLGTAFSSQYRFAAAESVQKKYIPKSISAILLASMVGALLGPNIASLAKDIISTSTYSGSYLFLSFLTIIPIFFFIFYTNEKSNNEYIDKNQITRNYSELLLQPKFTQAVVGAAIGYATMSFLMTATPISMHIFDGMSINKTGFVIQAHILSMFLPSLFTASLINKYGHSKIMYFGIVFFSLCIFINFLGHNFYNYLFSLMFLGLGWNFLFVSGTSLLILSYKSHERFKAQGLNDFSVFSTQATGALLAGFILNLYGWKITNLLCIPLLIIVIFVVYRSDKLSKEYK